MVILKDNRNPVNSGRVPIYAFLHFKFFKINNQTLHFAKA